MTTKVLIVCPDHSTHNAIVTVEKLDAHGGWLVDDQHSVAPTEQSPPVYIDGKTRVVITEEGREHVEPA